jgi:hypothetical protein
MAATSGAAPGAGQGTGQGAGQGDGQEFGYDATNDVENDPRVSTIPLDTEDGGTVVISQQTVGSDNEIGGGEFPDAELEKPIEKAAAEQERLEREAPTS